MKKNKAITSIALIILLVFGGVINNFLKENKELKSESVALKKCTDGDTAHFLINGVDKTVRFLAVDTPETVKPGTGVQPYGKEASNYTCSLLKKSKSIRLEYESEKTDKYGRVLAWIFVDDKLLQEQLISKGYAKVAYLYGDYKYTNVLKSAEEKAKSSKIGIWK